MKNIKKFLLITGWLCCCIVQSQAQAALNFDGTNDHVLIPASSTFNMTNGTIEMWIRPTYPNSGSNKCLVCTGLLNLFIGNNRDKIFVQGNNGTEVWTYAFTQNQWYHLALTVNAGSMTLYINGVSQGARNLGLWPNSGVVRLGSTLAGTDVFQGEMDELRFWNVARTQAQIQASMNCELLGGESGLKAYYRFNQSIGTSLADISGNNNTGTLTNFTLSGGTSNWVATGGVTTNSFCAPGAALAFDGTDDYINLGNPTSLQLNSGTVEFWVKTAPVVDDVNTLFKRNGFFDVYMAYSVLKVYDVQSGTDHSTGINIADNTWKHIALTFAPGANNSSIYVNGTLALTFTLSNAVNTGDINICSSLSTQATAMAIDECRIWNTVRTGAQILAHKDCEKVGDEPGLVACYHFNQSSGKNLTDATSNGNNGTLLNFTMTGSTSNWVTPGGVVTGTACPSEVAVGVSGLTDACGSTTLTAIGGVSYAWSTGSNTESTTITASGTYTVTATFSGGGTSTANVVVNILPLPAVPTISGTTTACDLVGLTANPSGLANYAWSNGANTAAATFTKSGTYTVTITDANGCTASASQTVTIHKATPSISGTADGCDQVTLTAAGGTLYTWTGGATGASATFNLAGNYTVTATDANGCTATASHTIFNVAKSIIYYLDADGDGYGDSNNPVASCAPLPGYIQLGLDCDDTNPAINPGAEEICDDIDNNCNGILIEKACAGSNAPVAAECSTRSTIEVLTGRVFFNYGSFTNARNTINRSSSTIGQPCVGMTIGDEQNVGFGFWTRFLLSPSAPTVVATQGDLPDRVQINWSADPLSPAAATYKIYRNGALLATVDNETFAFIDFNVLAGQFYTYEVAGVNQFGEGRRGSSLGFLNPNGVVTGQIRSISGNPVVDATIKLSPTLGAAVEFNGISTIFAEYSPTFPKEKFTLSCWAKIADGNPSTENTGIFDFGSSIGKNWWLHAVTPANGSKGVKFGIGKNPTTKTEIEYTLPEADKNDWHHYAATYNGSALLFYVDGELIGTAVGEMASDSTVLFMGKRSDEGGYFKGKLDELRFYNRQLAQTEVQMTKNLTVSPNAEGLTSYWKFDEGTGSRGFDLTLNKVKAYLCGATWTTDKPTVVNAGISNETGFYQIEGVNYGAGTTFTAAPSKDFHFNQSLEFNAANQSYANLTDFDLPDSATVEVTVKNFDFSANQVILSKEGHFELGLTAGKLNLKMGGTAYDFGPLQMGYHRLTFVMHQTGSSTAVNYYKNGTPVGSTTFSGVAADFSGGSPWTLGRNAAGNYFTGLIDEVAVFNTLLPLSDIQTFSNIGTSVTHPNLHIYFNLNEGAKTELRDMGTALTGKGMTQGATWSTVAKITETLPHKFTPSTRLVTLNPSNTSADQVDFMDQSTIPVSGYVRFEGTTCFQKGVEILVNGEHAFPLCFTDSTGYFSLDLEPGESVTLSPVFKTHQFSPAFWQIDNIATPIAGILFRNQTKRTISGQMAGNDICRKSVIPTGAVVKVKVETLDGCFYKEIQLEEANGKFKFEDLPPLKFTVAVTEHSNNVIYNYFQLKGGVTVDLTEVNDTTDFIYYAPPQIQITPLDTNACGQTMLTQDGKYTTEIRVYQQYDGGVCYLDTAALRIDNLIEGDGPLDTVMTEGKLKYKFTAGFPNITAPYTKTLTILAKANEQENTFSTAAVVLGKRPRLVNFTSTAPQIPLIILRDPPGDGSSATIEKGKTLCTGWSIDAESSVKASVGLTVDLGNKQQIITGTPVAGKITEIGLENTLDFGASVKTTGAINKSAEVCITNNETISTSSGDVLQGEDADVYMGGALNLLFGITDDLKWDTLNCAFKLDTGLLVFPDKFATTFLYSGYQIKKVVIPNLMLVGDTASVKQWETILQRNRDLKAAAVFEKNLSFDAGVTYQNSSSTETTDEFKWSIGVEVEASTALAMGFKVSGTGATVKLGLDLSIGTKSEFSKKETRTQTVSYTLADDDIKDVFTVNVLQDKVYGTPVFKTVSGNSSCPYEENTVPRDGVDLTVDKTIITNVSENDAAVFKFNIGNTSQTDEYRTYYFELYNATNPNGAVAKVQGTNNPSGSFGMYAGQSQEVTVSVERGPIAYDYDNLTFHVYSACEGARYDALGNGDFPPAPFYKAINVSVHYLEPCSPIDIGNPLQNWVHTLADGDFMFITLNEFNRNDPDLELIRVQYRLKQGDGAWINIAEVPKSELDNDVFKIVQWNTASLRDGEYEIRAVTECVGGQNAGISHVITGRFERESPALLGTPEPADGVLGRGDEISIRFNEPIRCDQLIQADVFDNNNIGLYDTETGNLVDAVISCSGDKIVIVPNVPNRFIEGKILRVEVNNIKDLANNVFVEKKWEFFVDRNPIRWEGGNIKVSKLKPQFVTVTRRILNDGGQATSFDIEGVPAWVRVSPTSGVIQPGAAEDITFEFDSSLVFGNYLDTIHIDAPEGREPLIVNCRVLCESPDWQFSPAAYPQTMNFVAKLDIEGQLSTDEEDIVAAFIDGELRGTAKLQLLPTLPPLGTQYMAFLTVYGDDTDDNKPVKLEIWDASACLRYGAVVEQFNFEVDNVVGTLGAPTILHTNSMVRRDIPLRTGWNWISFNLLLPDPALNPALVSLKHPANDLIKAQTTFAEYFGGWFGSLNALNNKSMFQFRADQPDTIIELGALIDPSTVSIPVATGWNWIGYVPNYALSVTEALKGLTPLNGDIVKGQTAFAQYLAGFGWLGSLQFMEAPNGYQLKISNPGNLVYPPQAPNKPGTPVSAVAVPSPTLAYWQVDATRYEHSMTLVGMLSEAGANATQAGYELGAFVGNELRGSAQAIYVGPVDAQLFFLTVYANTSGEQLQFKLYNPATGQIMPLTEKMYFANDQHQGGIENPVPFTLKTNAVAENAALQSFEVDPNPFNTATTLAFRSERAQTVRLLVSDARGRTILSRQIDAVPGMNTLRWEAKDASAGVYFVRLEMASGTVAKKVVKD